MEKGWIWVENGEVVGVASDGTIVNLGNLCYNKVELKKGYWIDKATRDFLESHPNSEDW